jgi:hypothetical protein
MKTNEAGSDRLHDDDTPKLGQDKKEDVARTAPCDEPQIEEDRGHAAAASEHALEENKKPVTSLRKTEANRRNASKSTGPRTAAGKSRVSRNALKHGIFSKHLLINDPQGGEHADEYWQLYAAIREHYEPQGLLEELWIDKIATWNWRLTRVVRCETGQIHRALASHRSDLQQKKVLVGNSPALALPDSPEDALVDDLLIPGNGELDKLLRYEEAISNHLNHAIAELERLQMRR